MQVLRLEPRHQMVSTGEQHMADAHRHGEQDASHGALDDNRRGNRTNACRTWCAVHARAVKPWRARLVRWLWVVSCGAVRGSAEGWVGVGHQLGELGREP